MTSRRIVHIARQTGRCGQHDPSRITRNPGRNRIRKKRRVQAHGPTGRPPPPAPPVRHEVRPEPRAKKNARGSRIHPTPLRASNELPGRARRGGLLLVPLPLEKLALLVLSHLLAALLDHTTHWKSPCSARFAPVHEWNELARTRLVCRAGSPIEPSSHWAGPEARGGLEAGSRRVKQRGAAGPGRAGRARQSPGATRAQ